MNSQNIKACIMDQAAVDRAITRIAHEIIEKNKGVADLAIVGIQRRGVPIARDIADRIKKIEGNTLPFGILDITLYRDDLAIMEDMPKLNGSDIPFDVTAALHSVQRRIDGLLVGLVESLAFALDKAPDLIAVLLSVRQRIEYNRFHMAAQNVAAQNCHIFCLRLHFSLKCYVTDRLTYQFYICNKNTTERRKNLQKGAHCLLLNAQCNGDSIVNKRKKFYILRLIEF